MTDQVKPKMTVGELRSKLIVSEDLPEWAPRGSKPVMIIDKADCTRALALLDALGEPGNLEDIAQHFDGVVDDYAKGTEWQQKAASVAQWYAERVRLAAVRENALRLKVEEARAVALKIASAHPYADCDMCLARGYCDEHNGPPIGAGATGKCEEMLVAWAEED